MELAQKVGLTQFTYSNYENEKTQPDIDILIKLCSIFNVTLDELVGHNVNNLVNLNNLSLSKKELITKILTCNDIICDKASAYMDALIDEGY